jgi:hypothetical protein
MLRMRNQVPRSAGLLERARDARRHPLTGVRDLRTPEQRADSAAGYDEPPGPMWIRPGGAILSVR